MALIVAQIEISEYKDAQGRTRWQAIGYGVDRFNISTDVSAQAAALIAANHVSSRHFSRIDELNNERNARP